MANDSYHIKAGPSAAAGVDAYLEYRRIVGDDDGGKMFTPEEYEQYKKEKLPQRLKNRLFVSWSAPQSHMDCKLIGPETPCFCTHRYKQHKTDFATLPDARPIMLPCRVNGCRCMAYHYVPLNGSQPLRCRCKHFADEHAESGSYKCKKDKCTCTGFYSAYTCGCGEATYKHSTLVETCEEREARGMPVGMEGVPYQAMGGLTGFSSLADGYMRIDPSGFIEQSSQWLEQPVTASDHPFLRENLKAVKLNKEMQGLQISEGDKLELESQVRKPGESEMDYYERRYQERQKQSKVYKPAIRGRGAKK